MTITKMDMEETIALLTKCLEMLDGVEAKQKRLHWTAQKLLTAIEEIEEYAQDKYDGPEDRHWGWVLARCQDARGG